MEMEMELWTNMAEGFHELKSKSWNNFQVGIAV